MKRRPPCFALVRAFTLVEMLVVMAVIAILAGLIIALNGNVQTTAARNRAANEIKSLGAACEAYKADNGGYPQGSPSNIPTPTSGPTSTDQLDPNPAILIGQAPNPSNFSTPDANPNDYQPSSSGGVYPVTLFLWQQLSGHIATVDSTQAPTATNYAGDFFRTTVLSGTKNANGQVTTVNYILDPFGNPYGYSTAGLYADQAYRASLLQNGTSAQRMTAGFNNTFDMWSTAGNTTWPTNASGQFTTSPWVKNW